MNAADSATENIRKRCWNLVLSVMFLSWFLKVPTVAGFFFQGQENAIVSHPLIPAWLCSPISLSWFLFLPALTIVVILPSSGKFRRFAAGLWAVCSLGMLWHVHSFNDATYVTAFWSSLWLFCWAPMIGRNDARSSWHGEFLAKCIISFAFMGGFLGKLTPEYYSGEAMRQIYFLGKDYFPFRQIREHWNSETIQTAAAWFSWSVIVAEGLIATSFLWPTRLAATATILVLSFMVAISRLQLLSVLGPLMALAIAALLLHQQRASASAKAH